MAAKKLNKHIPMLHSKKSKFHPVVLMKRQNPNVTVEVNTARYQGLQSTLLGKGIQAWRA